MATASTHYSLVNRLRSQPQGHMVNRRAMASRMNQLPCLRSVYDTCHCLSAGAALFWNIIFSHRSSNEYIKREHLMTTKNQFPKCKIKKTIILPNKFISGQGSQHPTVTLLANEIPPDSNLYWHGRDTCTDTINLWRVLWLYYLTWVNITVAPFVSEFVILH
jgi:hypothetical protein